MRAYHYNGLDEAQHKELADLDEQMEASIQDLEAQCTADGTECTDDMYHDLADSISFSADPAVRRMFMRSY